MDNNFKNLAKEIDFEILESFSNIKIQKAKLENKSTFSFVFEIVDLIPFGDMEIFMKLLNQNFKYNTKFQFNIINKNFTFQNIKNYISMIIKLFFEDKKLSKEILSSNIKKKDNYFLFLNDLISLQKINKIKEKLNKIIWKFGFENIKIDFLIEKNQEDILFQEKEKYLKKAEKIISNQKEVASQKIILRNNNGYQKIKIHELKNGFYENVILNGFVFDIEEKETKNGWIIITFSLTDYKEAIYAKYFVKKEDKEKIIKIEKRMTVEVFGKYQVDSFTKENFVNIKKIRELKKSKKNSEINSNEEKRIEFLSRTRMSTMDGISSPIELINKAIEMGHKGICISDLNSVQSFPEFFHSSRNKKIKAIYGTTINVISKNINSIYWPKNNNLKNDSYIVFDLETTGLSPEYEDIIEFGAVKLIDGKIVDKKQFFVKPNKSIPKEITNITNITNDDVKNAKLEKDAILDMKNFLEQGTIVAHNANFDITFINSKLIKYGYEKLTIPVIDTLVVARITHPFAKKFKLERVASRYKVHYDSQIAHRAEYDANVLAQIWLKMINDLKEQKIINQKDLYNFYSKNVYEKQFAKEIQIIAKNQKGLKEMFCYISKGLTQNYFNGLKIFFEDILNKKNVFLCSGSLNSRLVEKMIYGSKDQIKKEISYYDVIEVQPIINFLHLINRNIISKEDLEDIIKFVVLEAKKQNKIVIATGDVRYIDKKDKIYHEVYINSKGLGGRRHHLFKFNEENPIYPNQHFLTTSEMKKEFNFLNDINLIEEIVVKNTNKLFNLIENIEVIKKDLYTPTLENADENLSNLVYKNARLKYGDKLPKIIEKRINKELIPIKKYGFAVIYWISYLLVKKSLKDGYLVGSRGSVGSSFVATMAEITEVNPLQPHYVCLKCKDSIFPEEGSKLNSGYDLKEKKCLKCNIFYNREGQNIPFETFLGFEANKVPDIDLNFSGDYQPIIHNEVKKIFGESHVFRAGTISTVAEKTAFGYVKTWAEENNKEISKPFIDFLSKKVAGTKRTTGQHPGGIIVIPKEYDVEDFSPINYPANDINSSWKTTHFDFHAIHDNVLKLDLLGHDDPTVIKHLEEITNVNVKKDISFSDPKIISLFSSPKILGIKPEDINGEKTGVMGIPEFGTQFVRKMLNKTKVNSFGDLIAISGLSHGTDVWTNNSEILVEKNKIKLNELISCRDNIMVDLINKNIDPLISFNIMEKVRKGKGITIEEEKILKKHKVKDWYIDSLKKIKYMFPKAHATAYVMMAWRIAWFKIYKPLAYYATYFTDRSDVFDIETILEGVEKIKEKLINFKSRKYKWGSDKLTNKEVDLIPIYEIALEVYARKIKIENINLEKSKAKKWIIDEENNSLIPPFNSLDGLGNSIAESIVLARTEKSFTSIEDLKKRTSINKNHIESFKEMKVTDHLSETNQISFNLFDI